MFIRSFSFALLVGAVAYAGAGAQQVRETSGCPEPAPKPTTTARDTATARRDTASRSSDAGPVDIVIFAAASAREVRFATQPEIRVRLCGGLDSVHVIERRNLPNPVVAGTTYRDVYIAVEIFGRLNADCIAARITGQARPGLDCAQLELRGAAGRSGSPP